MMMRYNLLLILLLLLGACASTPTFNTAGVDRGLTPKNAVTASRTTTGRSVYWGGSIIDTTNLQDHTRVEVLAYPLDSDGRPQTDRDSLGRFMIIQGGYLEPANYVKGRLLTVVGEVSGKRIGEVGEASYDYPLIEARQLYLWPVETYRDGGANVFFGFGVGSGGGSGAGLGIGF
jgi:outer membrane lipoprotein